jgi:hypothetical protein
VIPIILSYFPLFESHPLPVANVNHPHFFRALDAVNYAIHMGFVPTQQMTKRAVNSTRYAMFGAYFVKHFSGRPRTSFPHVFEALPDAFGGAGFRRRIQEISIRFFVLDDGFGFPVKVFHEPSGIAQEVRLLSLIAPLTVFRDRATAPSSPQSLSPP